MNLEIQIKFTDTRLITKKLQSLFSEKVIIYQVLLGDLPKLVNDKAEISGLYAVYDQWNVMGSCGKSLILF